MQRQTPIVLAAVLLCFAACSTSKSQERSDDKAASQQQNESADSASGTSASTEVLGTPKGDAGELEAVQMSFDWPTEARVRVAATVEQSSSFGRSREMDRSFEFRVEPHNGDGYAVKQHKLLPAKAAKMKPKTKAEFKKTMATAYFALPTIQAKSDGSYTGVADAGALSSKIGGAVKFYLKKKGAPKRVQKSVLRAMSKRVFKMRGREFWSVLVQNWNGRRLALGSEVETSVDNLATRALKTGDSKANLTYEVQEADCPAERCVEVRAHFETKPDSKKLQKAFGRVLKAAAKPGESVQDATMKLTYRLTTEPASMKPHAMVERRVYEITLGTADKKGRTLEKKVEKTYDFQWSSNDDATDG